MTEETVQFIAILVTVAGLLGWLLKQVVTFFIKTFKIKDSYIEKLVEQNQLNTTNFIDTINHQRTQDRAMQHKHLEMLGGVKDEIKNTNELNTKLFNFLKDK